VGSVQAYTNAPAQPDANAVRICQEMWPLGGAEIVGDVRKPRDVSQE
jgi:hypothetical protein